MNFSREAFISFAVGRSWSFFFIFGLCSGLLAESRDLQSWTQWRHVLNRLFLFLVCAVARVESIDLQSWISLLYMRCGMSGDMYLIDFFYFCSVQWHVESRDLQSWMHLSVMMQLQWPTLDGGRVTITNESRIGMASGE